ncbi:bis(5'-nucleosyl)-tetraphosphatase (symmetrical) ApaH [Aliivibrio kagoshimensis]|uniref:bis(5'-nucleosyl)-tetraphosphatase (symmetrical) ApaH n=1 Tax=Aliivibrio kagoshimensis TaxID=2910230 RepID=UPI003D151AD0
MATYLVGDLQGCLDELIQLLDMVQFDRESDQLWITGDLVARGPKSLETLRFVKNLGSSAVTILGNHDLHLLAVSQGICPIKDQDKTRAIFEAEDSEALLLWLRQQPLLAQHPSHNFIMCHAGISPQWDLATATECAREVESVLKSKQWIWLLANMYCNTPDQWQPDLNGIERYRYIINAFTRMRFCHLDGRLDMACKLPLEQVDENSLIPWFSFRARTPIIPTIIFGHWAALMGYQDKNVIGLDTGCVWGNKMTMLRWEDKTWFESLPKPQ